MKVHELEDELNSNGKGKKAFHSQKGHLIRFDHKLAVSTKGKYLESIRNKKMKGGIFELIKLKKKIDKVEHI